MNITPRNILKGTNSNGTSFRAEEWDFNTLAQIELTGLIGIILISIVLSSFISAIFLIFCAVKFNSTGNLLNVIGILVSTYFLVDCSHGWVTLWALWCCFDESTINTLIGLNVACILAHVVLLFFGGIINQTINGSKPILIVILGIVMAIGFAIGISTHSDKGWVIKNINPDPRYWTSETK